METLNLEFIKSRRELLKIPQHEMASHLGYRNASTYLKYEQGIYSFKAEQLPVLARVLKCEISDFFSLEIAKTAI